MRSTLFAAMWLIVSGSACAMDGIDDDATGTTEQDISGWVPGSWGTTTDLVGFDTGWATSSTVCVMTGVDGNLGEGGYWDVMDEPSVAAIEWTATNWRVIAHGGAYTNQVNQRVWANNPVNVSTVCIPYPATASASWRSQQPQYGIAPPVKISSLAPNRRCFLQAIYGGGMIFTHSGDFVRVVKQTSTDTTHPTTGWYIEGNLQSNQYTGQPASARGVCTDFPTVAAEWWSAFGGATYTTTVGGDNQPKMCGLTGVYGAYNVNSWTNGANLNWPSWQGGNWSMTVSANKFAEANCIE